MATLISRTGVRSTPGTALDGLASEFEAYDQPGLTLRSHDRSHEPLWPNVAGTLQSLGSGKRCRPLRRSTPRRIILLPACKSGVGFGTSGSGKNVIRFGAGVYYNQVDGAEWIREVTDYHFSGLYTLNYPNTAGIVSTFPHLPVPSPALPNGAASEQSLSPYTVTPVFFHYGLDYQRQLTRTMTAKVGYVGWYGMHMPRLIHGNIGPGTTLANGTIFYPSTTTSLNPTFWLHR